MLPDAFDELRLTLWSQYLSSPIGKTGLVPGLQVSKEGHFQAGPGNLGYFGGPQEERNLLKSILLQMESYGEFLAWLFCLKGF